MQHVHALADPRHGIGVRVVGSPGLERAEIYVADAARELVRVAKETRAGDLDVDFMLQRATGSFRLNFLNNDIANAYTNLTNLAVRIAPKGMRSDTGAPCTLHPTPYTLNPETLNLKS